MILKEGAYENLITNELQQDMLQAETEGLVCKQENIDSAESPSMLTEHIAKLVRNRLSDEKLNKEEKAAFINRLIDFLGENSAEKVADVDQMLSAVVNNNQKRYHS